MAVLGDLPKLERGLELGFEAYFLDGFSIKCSFLNTLSTDKVSMSYPISFSRYDTKCIKFLCRQLMASSTLSSVILESNGRQGKKRGRRKDKNVNISKTKRAF